MGKNNALRDQWLRDFLMDFYILYDKKHEAIVSVKPSLEEAVNARKKYEQVVEKIFLKGCTSEEERQAARPDLVLHRVNFPTGVAILAKDREKAIRRAKENGLDIDASDDELRLD